MMAIGFYRAAYMTNISILSYCAQIWDIWLSMLRWSRRAVAQGAFGARLGEVV